MPADFDISPVIPPAPVEVPPASTPPQQGGSVFGGPSLPSEPMPKSKSPHRLLKGLVIFAVGLLLLTVASLWWGGNSFSANGVQIEIEAADQASSGDQITYTVTYRNDTKIPLTEMSFRLFYPPRSIVMKDGQPTTPDSEGFTVERLNPGQSATKEFKAYVIGDKGTIAAARVHVIFKAGTLRSSFEKDASTTTTITSLPAALTLVAPPTSVSGQPIGYILDLRNDTQQDMSDLKVVFTYPDGFTVQKMQPQPNEGNTTWRIAQLKAGQGTRITIDGTLVGNERDAKTVAVALQHNINGQYVDYVNTDASTVLSSPLLSVSITPNDSRDYVSFAGDTLRYTIGYANNSQYSLIGLSLKITLEGDMYDLPQLRAINGSFNDSNRTVTFDSSGVPDFASLSPGKRGTVTFSVPLKPGLSSSDGSKNFFVKATARFTTSNVPSGINGSEVFAVNSLITKISSQPSVTQAILYDNGSGSGPVPPQVGQETILTVNWQLVNPGNDVRNTTLTATLPPGATFKGNATANVGTAPAFNAASNKVTWNIGTLPYGTGNGLPRAQGQFQISIKPSSNQQGQVVPLVTGAALTGTDSFTNQPVQLTLNNIGTESIQGHSGQGAVVQ